MGGLWYVIIVFFVLFSLRLPIAMVLICSTMVGLWFAPTPIALSTLPTTLWQGVNHFVLLAIPFFILMGDLALASGVTQRLVNLAKAFVGTSPADLPTSVSSSTSSWQACRARTWRMQPRPGGCLSRPCSAAVTRSAMPPP